MKMRIRKWTAGEKEKKDFYYQICTQLCTLRFKRRGDQRQWAAGQEASATSIMGLRNSVIVQVTGLLEIKQNAAFCQLLGLDPDKRLLANHTSNHTPEAYPESDREAYPHQHDLRQTLSVCLPVCLSFCLSVCLSVCLTYVRTHV